MNTIEELMRFDGIGKEQAILILDKYKSRIGYTTVDYKVTDITYMGNGYRDIEMTCINCGEVIHKSFCGHKNKWSELRKYCNCRKQVNSEKISKNKKTVFNDNPEYIGKVYGDYKVTEIVRKQHKNKSGSTVQWVCKCVHCKDVKIKIPADLKNDRKSRCVCQKGFSTATNIVPVDYENYIGAKYNRLKVLSFRNVKQGKRYHKYAICKCDCGENTEVQWYQLTKGLVKSCGCYQAELRDNAVSRSPLYSTWAGMKYRCENPKCNNYEDYGGRGITVCDEWQDFRAFEKWAIENGFDKSQGLTLDRIDVNKGYSPDNCRYANKYVQAVNQRPRRNSLKNAQRVVRGRYEVNGIFDTKKNWCQKYKVNEATVTYRMKHMGMTFEEALIAEKKTEGNHLAALNLKIKNPNVSKQNDVDTLNKCQSYIETNLYMAFLRKTDKYILLPQEKIGKYRVDFLVEGRRIVVECDGYDYHKTKEQLLIDCKRQRDLTLQGYQVIRFSGTEINDNPDKCVKELLDMIEVSEICE